MIVERSSTSSRKKYQYNLMQKGCRVNISTISRYLSNGLGLVKSCKPAKNHNFIAKLSFANANLGTPVRFLFPYIAKLVKFLTAVCTVVFLQPTFTGNSSLEYPHSYQFTFLARWTSEKVASLPIFQDYSWQLKYASSFTGKRKWLTFS